jgi:hypothetical protein
MQMMLFNLKEFDIMNLLLQDTSFTAVYFVDNVIIPLARRLAIPGRYLPLQTTFPFRKFQVSYDSACPRTDGQSSVRLCFLPRYSLNLATPEFYLFGWLKQQPSERTLGSEQNVLEMVADILNKLSKNDVNSAFRIRRKDVGGALAIMESLIQVR